MDHDEEQPPISLSEGVVDAEKAAAARKNLAAVAHLRALGVRSVGEVGWLAADNVARPLRTLLTVRGADGRPRPFMPAGKLSMLIAPGGTGKTQTLVQVAVCVGSGLPLFDEYEVSDPGPVLLVLGEEDMDEMHRRVRGTVDAMPAWPHSAEIDENLHVLSLCGQPAGFTDKDGGRTPFFDQFYAGLEASGIQWRLIILDPASRFLGPDAEKDNAAATRWIEVVERLTQLPSKPAVLFAHHTNKSAVGGGTDQTAARGSSALTDGVRWQGNLERVVNEEGGSGNKVMSADRVTFKVVKVNHCRQPPPLELARDFEHGGFLRPVAQAKPTATPTAATASRPRGRDPRRELHDDV